nr:transposase [Phaeobacter sp. 22II1-1F12B]
MAKRRNFTDQFKAKVALEALRGDKTVQEIAAKHQLHPNQVSTWKRQAIEGMADVFSGGKQSGPTESDIKELHAKIGRLAVENDLYEEKIVNWRADACRCAVQQRSYVLVPGGSIAA